MNLTGITLVTKGSVMEAVPTEVAKKRSSPSKYRSIELSPAFVQDPDRPDHPTTLEGTAVHQAVETGDDRGLAEHLRRYAQMCRDFVSTAVPADAKQFKEIRLPVVGEDYGFADFLAIKGSTAYLIDYKIGFNAQEEVEVNPAAQGYVLGVMTVFPYVEKVHVWYIYPRLEEVSYGTYTRKDIPRITARIQLLKDRHNAATPETCSYHDDTCTYCLFLAKCPVAAKHLLPIAARYAAAHDMQVPEFTDLALVNDQQKWSRLLKFVPALESAADSIRRRALEWRDNTGIEIDGYSVRETKGTRKIVDPSAAWEEAKARGVTESAFLNCVDVGISDYLKVVRETAGKGKKGEVEQQVVNALMDAGALTQSEPGRYLVRDKTTDVQ